MVGKLPQRNERKRVSKINLGQKCGDIVVGESESGIISEFFRDMQFRLRMPSEGAI